MDTSTTWHTCSGCTLKAHCRGAWWDESHAAYRRDLGEEIEIKTWVENVRRVRSLRKYESIRKSDGKVLVKGETDWVFVDAKKVRRAPSLRKCPKYLQ